MNVAGNVSHVFISSTISDMQAERDALQLVFG
jgi:hypothetical protein